MNSRLQQVATVLVAVSVSHSLLWADWTCDFESGIPKEWRLSSSVPGDIQPVAEVSKRVEGMELKLARNAILQMGDTVLSNFSVEATVRRQYDRSDALVGFQFRNGYAVYLRRPGQVELSGPNGVRMLGFSRNLQTDLPLRFRVVAAGPIIRFFINGQFEGQFVGAEEKAGPLALYQRDASQAVFFDDVVVRTEIEPDQFLVCEPISGADPALVFSPDQEVLLRIRLTNHSGEPRKAVLKAVADDFSGGVVGEASLPETSVPAGEPQETVFRFGRLPEGYYRVVVQPTGETFPLAVQTRGTVTHDRIVTPPLLIGVYWYYWNWNLPPVWAHTYMHAACADLRRHHVNTIVCAIGMPTEMIEIASQYGIRCFTRQMGAKDRAGGYPDGNVAHPNVLGGFIGDEPKPGQEEQYRRDYAAALEKFPDIIWTTCMVGEGGTEPCRPWWNEWRALAGERGKIVPMVRWYGFKNYITGLDRTYGTIPPVTETLRMLSQEPGPFYFILPSFGNPRNPDAYYSNPLPEQLRGLMHLVVAFGARGLFFWTYQTPFVDHDALVDPLSLRPLDQKWEVLGRTTEQLARTADILAECSWAGRYRFVEGPAVLEVFELERKGDSSRYFYAINIDPRQKIAGRIFKLEAGGTIRDLFSGRLFSVAEEEVISLRPDLRWKTGVMPLELAPGEGILLQYVPPSVAESGGAARPRVVYPDFIENVAKEKILWLADLEPLEMPNPGWIPRKKYKDKKWYPDFHSHDITLFSGRGDAGQLYRRSLYAHADTRIRYALPPDAAFFVAVAGFGSQNDRSSAIFRVLVDGEERYNSGVLTVDSPVEAVVVEVSGGKVLELITEDAGDGLYGDYTFWGEARLILR